jgi:hypothetical protein|mmetsp:Transcript_28972/g.48112  ORF Transcript_28972/g.48112 Transcript_28972/m.48112 type:complete len:84 (-) Transcript_28972:613-864(-)
MKTNINPENSDKEQMQETEEASARTAKQKYEQLAWKFAACSAVQLDMHPGLGLVYSSLSDSCEMGVMSRNLVPTVQPCLQADN